MPFIDARGSSMHVDVTGSGADVVFLHGGLCSAEVMRALSEELDGYAVTAPERPAHGRTADRGGPFHYADGVDDTLAVLDALGLDRVHLVGFSDGANIAMLLALAHPARVRSLVHISGNLHPGNDVWRMDQDDSSRAGLEEIERENAALSPDGPERLADIEARIMRMWETEPAIAPDELGALGMPVLVMAGDRDMIALEHTASIAAAIPRAQLAIVPGTTHLLVREAPAAVGAILQRFLDEVGD